MASKPHPRAQLTSAFRRSIRADARGINRLSVLAGFTVYVELSRVMNHPFAATAQNLTRLATLAAVIGFDGEQVRYISQAELERWTAGGLPKGGAAVRRVNGPDGVITIIGPSEAAVAAFEERAR